MYMNPTIPIVTPVLQPLVETFVKENVIAKDAVRLILMIVLVTAISAIVGLLLHKRMKKQWLRTNKTVALLLSAVMAIALSIRFGLSIYISGAVSVLSAPVCLGVGSDRQAGCRPSQCLGIGTLADQCSDSRNHLHADRRCSQFRNSDRCQRIFRWQIRRCGYQNFLRLCFSPRMVKRSDRSCARTPHRRTVYADL